MAVIRKGTKKCVLCKHWNGAMGSTTLQAKPCNQFEYDNSEKQTCYKKGIKMPAWSTCRDFEERYK